MPVIKMMTIIVLVALMAIVIEEMSEASSTTSFAMEESTRMARMILNKNKDNNKSSTKFFMKENNKDEEASGLDSLYGVPRKEENVLGKKNKGNSEIKSQSQRRKSGGWKKGNFRTRKEDSLSFKYVGVHTTTHFISLLISHGKWWK